MPNLLILVLQEFVERAMSKGASIVKILIKNSDTVRSYDFSQLRSAMNGVEVLEVQKLTGERMTKRSTDTRETRPVYTFAL